MQHIRPIGLGKLVKSPLRIGGKRFPDRLFPLLSTRTQFFSNVSKSEQQIRLTDGRSFKAVLKRVPMGKAFVKRQGCGEQCLTQRIGDIQSLSDVLRRTHGFGDRQARNLG